MTGIITIFVLCLLSVFAISHYLFGCVYSKSEYEFEIEAENKLKEKDFESTHEYYKAVEALGNKNYKKQCSKIRKLSITVALLVSIIVGIASSYCLHNYYYYQITCYNSVKSTYESAMQSETLTGLDRIDIITKVAEQNRYVAIYQRRMNKWYGCLIPNEMADLEPIEVK